MAISETNIPALNEALFDQQQLLQKLYSELDAEREATASAATESLSMILRVQEEKAAAMMEAKQYKRLAEEKMWHAQQTLELFEDLIYQKQMEVASLEFQVQAYRYKLMSLGGTTTMSRREMLSAISLPSLKVEEYYDHETVNSGYTDSYWEQIQKLDERVKEISREKLVRVTVPPSPLSDRESRNVTFGDGYKSVASSFSFSDGSVVSFGENHSIVPENQQCETATVLQRLRQICVKMERFERNLRGREASLKDNKDQPAYIRKDISWNENRKTRHEDDTMTILMEAMLHFW